MKNLILLFCLSFLSFSIIAQDETSESSSSGPGMVSIADLMNVAPVAITMSEEVEKNKAEYEKTWTDEKARLDKALTALNEDYTKEVGSVIEDFTKILDKGIQQDVDNEEKSVCTKVNALTFGHRKNKKDELTAFNNKMEVELRERNLPRQIDKEKTDQLEELLSSYKDILEEEFETNQMVIQNFKDTEHLVESDMIPTSSDDSDN